MLVLCCPAVVLLLFAAFSVLLYIFLIGYLLSVKECKPVARVISPFIEAPFLVVQVNILTCWEEKYSETGFHS